MEERTGGIVRELRPHALWDFIKEGVKLMLPFLAGLGIREWVHDHATALMWTAAVVVAGGVAFWDRIEIKKSLQLSVGHPLLIISARWGLGGDVYKDVTKIVRNHAKPDSINMPASIGVLGDPYPGDVKHLRVDYMIGKRLSISVPESRPMAPNHLILPEKEGEEQERKQKEQMSERLQKLQQEVSLSAADSRTFNDLKTEFIAMPWAQKLALRAIYQHPGIDLGSLVRSIESYGFGQNVQTDIVIPLVDKSRFVDAKDRRNIERHPLNYKFVEEFLEGWEKYPF